ncbi:uncharacterized protein [Garra rufa]|uniref:uncharacterized protein n=1 Tax=Garra rufa TaxID=137080 RepID=UPI003CCE684D
MRSAAVKMVFVKEESEEDMNEPEPWKIKQEELEPCRIKQEEPDTSRIVHEEPEACGIKHEEREGMVKEERHDLSGMGEKHQCQKDSDENGEQSVSCSNQITGVKRPLICSQCGNAFKQKISLLKHMRIHTGEKPYTCSQCGNSFTQKSALNPLKAGVADLQQLKTNYLITPDTYFMSFSFLLRSTTAGLGCPLATNIFLLAHQMAV